MPQAPALTLKLQFILPDRPMRTLGGDGLPLYRKNRLRVWRAALPAVQASSARSGPMGELGDMIATLRRRNLRIPQVAYGKR